MKQFLIDHKQFVFYVLFGVGTTAVNIGVYYLLFVCLEWSVTLSTVIAWIASVFFAYVTNKLYVFNSRGLSLGRTLLEMLEFFGMRLATGVLDLGIMKVSVDVCHGNGMVWKILSNIIVVLLNYIASKLLFFQKCDEE